MGYRDAFFQRLKDDGLWVHCTDEQRQAFEQLSDEQAGRTMAALDGLRLGDPETTEQVGKLVFMDAFKSFLDVFGGRLLVSQGDGIGGLSKAGLLLAEFIDELEKQGIDWATIATDFPKLNNTSLIICLRQLYSRRNDQI